MAVSAASPAASRVAADGDRAVRAWLFIVALLVFSMVVVGGATRLTEVWPVDHRVAAAARRHSPAQRSRLAGGVREVQGDPRVQHRERRHVARRLQVYLLVGMDAPPARAPYRRGLRHPIPRVLGYGPAAAGSAAEAVRRAGAGRPAGFYRLVHGEIRARRPHRREPVPARAASVDRVVDPVLACLARARCRARASARALADGDACGAALCGDPVRAHLPAGRARRPRCRTEGWPDLQYLASDGRPLRARRGSANSRPGISTSSRM